MYKVACVNEYGEVYTSKGLLSHYEGDAGSSIREFNDLDGAKEYGRSFVDTYPQAVCEIYHEKQIIEAIRDEAYWRWKNKNTEEWTNTRAKMGRIQFIVSGILLSVLGVLIAIVSHYLANLPLIYKMAIFPLILIAGAYVFNRVFAKIC